MVAASLPRLEVHGWSGEELPRVIFVQNFFQHAVAAADVVDKRAQVGVHVLTDEALFVVPVQFDDLEPIL